MLGQLESTTKSPELNLVREPKSGCMSIFKCRSSLLLLIAAI